MADATMTVQTFNSPIETGIRALILLAQSYPSQLDLQRLLEYDYIMVHTGDVDGRRVFIRRCRFAPASFWSAAN